MWHGSNFSPCSFACSWFFAFFVSFVRQLVKASLMQPCHIVRGPGPRFYRLFSDAAGSSCQNGHDLYESDLVARIAASAGIWTGLDLTWWWTMSKKLYRVWSSTLTVSTGQSLCILFSAILLVTTIDVVMGSWNWGGGAWVANERWVLWSSTTLQPRCCNQHIQRSTWQVSVYNSEAPSVTDTWRTNSLIIGTHLSVTRQHHVLLTNNWCMV